MKISHIPVEWFKERLKNKTQAEIANELGCSRAAVCNYVSKNNLIDRKATPSPKELENMLKEIDFYKISEKTGYSYSYLCSLARKYSLKTPQERNSITKDFLEEELKTKSYKQISKETGKNLTLLRKIGREYGIKRSKHGHLINEKFFQEWSHEMAYILGFTYADGYVSWRPEDKHYYLKYELQSKDIEILEFIRDCIQPTANIYNYEKPNKKEREKPYKCVNLTLASKYMLQDIMNLGCIRNKTYEGMKFPDCPEQFLPDFIRGFFDGDGSVSCYKNKNNNVIRSCSITCSDLSFLESILDKLNFGYITSYENDGFLTLFLLKFCSKEDINNFFNFIYNGNFCLQRKKDKFNEIISSF